MGKDIQKEATVGHQGCDYPHSKLIKHKELHKALALENEHVANIVKVFCIAFESGFSPAKVLVLCD